MNAAFLSLLQVAIGSAFSFCCKNGSSEFTAQAVIATPFGGERRNKGGCLGFVTFLITASKSQSSH